MSDVKVERIAPADEENLEEWSRVTEEPELEGVSAVRCSDSDWPWQIHVWVMEFIRTDPLESELAAAVSAALAAVPGVREAAHDDRETWVIKGDTDGPSLVRAASAAVDRFSAQTRGALDGLDSGT